MSSAWRPTRSSCSTRRVCRASASTGAASRCPSCVWRSGSSRSAARRRSASRRPWAWRRPRVRQTRPTSPRCAPSSPARAPSSARPGPPRSTSRGRSRAATRSSRRPPARRMSCGRRSRGSPAASMRTRSPAAWRWVHTAPRSCRRARASSRTATPGALATGGYGSALGVVRAAFAADPDVHVWVDETRPLLQGARLTAWELAEDGIPHTLIADVAAGQLFARGLVDAVVFGADRIAPQRRRGQQDRLVHALRARARARRALLRRRPLVDDRSRDRRRRRDPDRGARRRRGHALRRAVRRAGRDGRLEPGLRRDAGGQHHRDRHARPASTGAVRRRACRPRRPRHTSGTTRHGHVDTARS